MTSAQPASEGTIAVVAGRHDNPVGGDRAASVDGAYRGHPSSLNGAVFTRAVRSFSANIDLALDVAHTCAGPIVRPLR